MSGYALMDGMRPAEPLWRRVPSRDSAGRMLGDFMMLIPGLSKAPELRRRQVRRELEGLCRRHSGRLHLVDLNLRLNLLWVSVDAAPGMIPELVRDIRSHIPEAVLVAQDCGLDLNPALDLENKPRSLLARFSARILRRAGRHRALAPPDSAAR